MKTSIALGVSIITLALGAQASRADLIINGSFETPIAPPGSVVRFDSSNPSAMPGWFVTGQIEIVSGPGKGTRLLLAVPVSRQR